jgi:hypothetical protein
MFVDKAETARVRLLMRYLAGAERSYYKAKADLDKARADRRKQELEDAQHELLHEMCTGASSESADEDEDPLADGFVSQPAAAHAIGAAASPSAAAFHALG